MKYQEFSQTPHLDEGCALFYKEAGESKYHILLPLENIPAFVSDFDEVEYGYTTMKVNGLIKGRKNASSGETDFYWTRDFANKLKSLKGKSYDMLVVLPSWQGYLLRAEIDYSYNEISRNDLVTGTLSITPNWVDDTHIDDVRDLCMETAIIDKEIDTELTLSKTTYGISGFSMPISTYPASGTTLEFSYFSQSYVGSTASDIVKIEQETTNLKITPLKAGYDIIKIKTTATGYGYWETYIAVEVVA